MHGEELALRGRLPRPGESLSARFSLRPARLANGPISSGDLRQGVVLVTTLPNIERNSCTAQIVSLEEKAREVLPPHVRIVHVSADAPHFWREVDENHPGISSAGYTLYGTSPRSRANFVEAFGVGVEGHRRIARGVFALRDGVFVAAHVPYDQMDVPRIPSFVRGVLRKLLLSHG